MSADPVLELVSPSGARRRWTRAELALLPVDAQVPDVGVHVPGKQGRAVRLEALSGALPSAGFLNVRSSQAGFAVSLRLAELPRGALIVYELDGAALPPAKGGPFRLLVPGHADECVHVKSIAELELSNARGPDTRPADDEAHRALHAKKKAL